MIKRAEGPSWFRRRFGVGPTRAFAASSRAFSIARILSHSLFDNVVPSACRVPGGKGITVPSSAYVCRFSSAPRPAPPLARPPTPPPLPLLPPLPGAGGSGIFTPGRDSGYSLAADAAKAVEVEVEVGGARDAAAVDAVDTGIGEVRAAVAAEGGALGRGGDMVRR